MSTVSNVESSGDEVPAGLPLDSSGSDSVFGDVTVVSSPVRVAQGESSDEDTDDVGDVPVSPEIGLSVFAMSPQVDVTGSGSVSSEDISVEALGSFLREESSVGDLEDTLTEIGVDVTPTIHAELEHSFQ